MIRALAPYLIASLLIVLATGVLYGAGVIGVPAYYGLLVLATFVVIVGYTRWDEQHYG
jgi:hypothetical protein